MDDKIRALYIDCPAWHPPINPDDFIIAIGKNKSNSVYHVYKSEPKPHAKKRITRYNVKVFKSDLITALRRESDQKLFTMSWYNRNKKS